MSGNGDGKCLDVTAKISGTVAMNLIVVEQKVPAGTLALQRSKQ